MLAFDTWILIYAYANSVLFLIHYKTLKSTRKQIAKLAALTWSIKSINLTITSKNHKSLWKFNKQKYLLFFFDKKISNYQTSKGVNKLSYTNKLNRLHAQMPTIRNKWI